MTKFKLMALTLVIGTASLYVGSIDHAVEPDLDAAYEAEALENEAYEDAAFFKKLQKENEMLSYDKQGLEAFDKYMNDNYKKFLEEDSPIGDTNLKDKHSAQSYKQCNLVCDKKQGDKLYSISLKI